MNWRTELPVEITDRYDCGELHAAVFEHCADPGGPWCCVLLQVPETPRALFSEGMRMARQRRARILVLADTAEQIGRAVSRIERGCPHHRRISYERASGGGFGPTQ